jgi:hypothetical protein
MPFTYDEKYEEAHNYKEYIERRGKLLKEKTFYIQFTQESIARELLRLWISDCFSALRILTDEDEEYKEKYTTVTFKKNDSYDLTSEKMLRMFLSVKPETIKVSLNKYNQPVLTYD